MLAPPIVVLPSSPAMTLTAFDWILVLARPSAVHRSRTT